MWKVILALLKTKFPGVRVDALTNMSKNMEMAVASEDDAKKLVESLDTNKVEAFAKEYRSGIDKEITEANKTFEKGLRDKYDFKDKTIVDDDDPGKGGKGGGSDDIETKIANAMAKAMAPMTEFMTSMKAEKIATGRRSQVESILKDVPDSYKNRILKDFGRMSFQDDDAFNEYLTDTKTDVDAYVQEMADNGLSKSGHISFGQIDKNGVSAGVADYIKSQSADGGSDLGGKEL